MGNLPSFRFVLLSSWLQINAKELGPSLFNQNSMHENELIANPREQSHHNSDLHKTYRSVPSMHTAWPHTINDAAGSSHTVPRSVPNHIENPMDANTQSNGRLTHPLPESTLLAVDANVHHPVDVNIIQPPHMSNIPSNSESRRHEESDKNEKDGSENHEKPPYWAIQLAINTLRYGFSNGQMHYVMSPHPVAPDTSEDIIENGIQDTEARPNLIPGDASGSDGSKKEKTFTDDSKTDKPDGESGKNQTMVEFLDDEGAEERV